ncbi:POTRA domain-containing protein [Achromobacter xylosoxidans]|uniref:ShlB/FhaC/HecB family hemolysin secretion/activation protein n=1 Tax=Alcaligenes xylosoxydans xylosoxydans TaxID=85698 RepID=UPI000AAC9505|nr:POTRA domain-containing protein [Achromobacter xylosoxidans]
MHNLQARVDFARLQENKTRPCHAIFKLAPLALVLASASVAAQGMPPGAGALGNQLRQHDAAPSPAPATPALVLPPEQARGRVAPDSHNTVLIRKVVFTGLPDIKGVDEATLQRVVAGDLGRPQSFAGLSAIAQKVTDLYRKHGLLLARAILPAQTLKDGTLTIQVIPGRYDRAQIKNTSALRSSVAERMIRGATPEGELVTRTTLDREALLLNEIPGVTAQVSMASGTKSGTTTPEITLAPGKAYGAYVGLDNQGDGTTGRSRVMLGGYVNNLAGLGDQLRIDVLDAYEKSNLFNGAIDYSLLAGGAHGTRLGLNYSHLNYRYNLNRMQFKGYSDNAGVYVTQPWIRTARARVDVRLDAAQQRLTDNYPDLFSGLTASGGTRGRKLVSLGTLSVIGSVAGLPGGLTGFGASGTVGNVNLHSDMSRELGAAADSGGQFARLNFQVNHDQQISGPLSMYVGVKGQVANHNLDASQKFLMGGPSAVRAYDIGDGTVDQGAVASAELRLRRGINAPAWAGSAPQVTLAAFYDQGWGEQYRNNLSSQGGRLARDNHLNLAGAGLYLTLSSPGDYALTMTWARRTGAADPNAVRNDHDRFWLSAVKTF